MVESGISEQPLLYRATEVAKMLGLGRSTVFAMMASGQLPTVRIGRAVRIPRAGLERWLREQTGDPDPDPGTATRPARAAA